MMKSIGNTGKNKGGKVQDGRGRKRKNVINEPPEGRGE